MLPVDPSPSKEKQVKTQRVIDWMTQSTSITRPSVRPPLKRKIRQDENRHDKASFRIAKKLKPSSASKPMSPRKFYLPNDQEAASNTVYPLPSTPESKKTATSGSLCFSPDKLDGIFVRGSGSSLPAQILTSDSDSVASTPHKQKGHRLPCGLDSPETDGSSTKNATKVPGNLFSKLGHRLKSKSELQLFRENIRRDTRKLAYGSSRTPRIRSRLSLREDGTRNANEIKDRLSPLRLESDHDSEVSTVVSASSPLVPGPGATDEKDRSNNTLTQEGDATLVQKKLLPLFQKQRLASKTDRTQLVIDAGQKDLDDAKQCPVCRMVYTRGDPDDEALHRQFHSSLIQALKFSGWKKEHVAYSGPDHRILYIDDTDPPHCRKKVQALKVILDQELGYVQEDDILKPNRRIYLCVSEEKQIKGVCIAECISRASRLEGDKASLQTVPASIGVNRLWVYAKYRREGVATQLLDAIRTTFDLGTCLPRREIAFSDPTSHGRMFAAKFTGLQNFLVYKP
ncbi:N-acetyltransferase ESCO2-like isoform X2 [Watersipora subatra]|uniref:N-acetyltransferase ESCO2-like isoform X2 n=1 Tax=Watersipora subatra TaxID=2589382 RepID=UPI00355B5DC9